MLKKVLIIEDHEHIGTALKLLIELEGYGAVVADRAFKGRELAATIEPDLIIVDIMLPDEDGIELTRDLRSAPETRDTPIVCVSSHIMGLEAEVRMAGCNEVFTKTTFMEFYRETLRKYLGEPEVLDNADSSTVHYHASSQR